MKPCFKSENIVIHIGWPKTATRFLRQGFFDTDRRLNPVIASRTPGERDAAYKLITCLHHTTVGFEEVRKEILDRLVSELFSKDRVNILAAESLAVGSTPYNQVCVDPLTIAVRLKDLFPNAFVVINIRAQVPILKSTHVQLFSMMAPVAPRFETFLLHQLEQREKSLLPFYEYDRVIKKYRELFTKDRVRVLVYEDLRSNPEGFASALGEAVGICGEEILTYLKAKPKNRGSDKKMSPRILGKAFLYQSALKRPGAVLEFIRDGEPSKDIVSRIAANYRESNKKLQAFVSTDLSSRGYAV